MIASGVAKTPNRSTGIWHMKAESPVFADQRRSPLGMRM